MSGVKVGGQGWGQGRRSRAGEGTRLGLRSGGQGRGGHGWGSRGWSQGGSRV